MSDQQKRAKVIQHISGCEDRAVVLGMRRSKFRSEVAQYAAELAADDGRPVQLMDRLDAAYAVTHRLERVEGVAV